MPSDRTSASPAALIRTMDGHITFWSRAMEERYGYPAHEACGQVSRKLLRTTSWQDLDEIETELVERQAWHGGLIHYRADGQPLVAANYWRLHQQTGSQGDLVTELHADILPDTEAGGHLADVIATIAQEASQPLTAIGGYISGAQRTLRAASLDRQRLEQAMAAATAQLANAGEVLKRVRGLGENLRNPSQRRLHARLTETVEQTERAIRGVVGTRLVAERTRADVADARRARAGAHESRRVIALENVALFQRLLGQNNGLDSQTERAISQLLEEAEAKLSALDQR